MAEKIKWSKRSQRDRFEILEYWEKRNKSKVYSTKLNRLFLKSIEKVADFPESGIPTEIPNIRIQIVTNYFIYYNILLSQIEIVTIWDSRRDPAKFKL